jgi:type I restriction enzyme S subunit
VTLSVVPLETVVAPEKGAIKIGPFGSQLKKADLVNEGIHVLGIENVLSGRFDDLGDRFISPRKFQTLRSVEVKGGDLLITMMGTIGKVAIVPHGVKTSIMDSHLLRVRVNKSVCSIEYLRWAIQGSHAVRRIIDAQARGAIMRGLNSAIIRSLPIPLPPLDDQLRIAEILDKADALRAKRRAALAQLDTLTQSTFLDMFGDSATNPKGWPRQPIRNIGNVITGNTPSRANDAYFGDAIEWIKPDNLSTPDYYATMAEEGLSQAGRAVARTAPANSILVTCIAGSPTSIGNAAMVDREVAFNQQINALVPDGDDPHFLYAQLRIGKRLVQAASTGGMKGLVSKSRFMQISLMVPPVQLQREFAARVLAIEKLKTAHRSSLAELEALFGSLQERGFAGRL